MAYIRKFRLFYAALFLASAVQAQNQCSSLVTSAQAAADKAEWVFEADVVVISQAVGEAARFNVTVENVKMLYEVGQSPRLFTVTLRPSCFLNADQQLSGAAAKQLTGKRMRFYGTQMVAGRGRQFFYMQPVSEPAPSFTPRHQYVTAGHAMNASTPEADGWYRAHSAEGGFAIDMPGEFEDITKAGPGEPGFMVRGKDQYGSVYLAVFERSGPESSIGIAVDHTYEDNPAGRSMFKGAESVYYVGKNGERITHGLWFRVPGGSFMLGIVTEKEYEAASMKLKDRFFNSLSFD